VLPALRFLLFAAFTLAALARNAPALRRGLEVVTSPAYFSPSTPCLPCALLATAVAVGYCTWLAGATFQKWRMPLWAHLVPAAGLLATTWLGPLPMVPDRGAGGPADRAMEALRALARLPNPCATPAAELERKLESEAPPTGFRAFGRPIPFRVVVVPGAEEPVRALASGDGVGTVYLACPKGGTAYWLSVVVSEQLPRAVPALLRDGVGKVAVLAGEFKP